MNKGEQIFVRVTRYYTSSDRETLTDWASEDEPMWVMGRAVDNSDYEFINDTVLLAARLPDNSQVSVIKHDVYTFVPYDELPDEVIAEYTRRVMLDEFEGEN